MSERKKSKAELVRDEILRQIQIGNFARGAVLPPERELAEQLGASYMTVRKAVGQLVEEHYLERQPGVGTFVHAKISEKRLSKILAVVVPAYNAPEHFDFLNHVCRLADTENFLPRVVLARSWDDRAILDAYQNCDAMIMFCGDVTKFSNLLRQKTQDCSRPVVVVGSCAHLHGFDAVCGVPYGSSDAMMDHLIRNGHRHIGCVMQYIEKDGKKIPLDSEFYGSWSRRVSMLPGNSDIDKLLIDVKVPAFEQPHLKIYERLKNMGANLPFTAILSPTSMVCGVLAALYDLGKKIPEDISVVTIGDRQEIEFLRPRLTHFSVPLREHAVKALELIRFRENNPDAPPQWGMITEHFIEGETLRDISK